MRSNRHVVDMLAQPQAILSKRSRLVLVPVSHQKQCQTNQRTGNSQ